jgi:hypothetical protein
MEAEIPGASPALLTEARKKLGVVPVLAKAPPPQYEAQFPPASGLPPQQIEQAAQYVQPECAQFGSQKAGTSQVLQAVA